MTQEILNKLPAKVKESISILKTRYRDERFNRETSRAEARGYLKGLRDSEIINSDVEFRALYCFITI